MCSKRRGGRFVHNRSLLADGWKVAYQRGSRRSSMGCAPNPGSLSLSPTGAKGDSNSWSRPHAVAIGFSEIGWNFELKARRLLADVIGEAIGGSVRKRDCARV